MNLSRATTVGGSTGLALRRPHARGQALVETALVIPIFFLLLMAVFDLGRVVYAQHTITQDSREATRLGQVTPAYTTAQYAAIRTAALTMSPGTTLAAGNISGLAGTNCNAVVPAVTPTPPSDPTSSSSCFYPDGISIGNRVVVNISVTVPLLTPIISQLVGGSITVTTQSVAYIQ
jgi:Flp pilus assembly protein TadG